MSPFLTLNLKKKKKKKDSSLKNTLLLFEIAAWNIARDDTACHSISALWDIAAQVSTTGRWLVPFTKDPFLRAKDNMVLTSAKAITLYLANGQRNSLSLSLSLSLFKAFTDLQKEFML